MTLPIGTTVRSLRNRREGTIVGYGALSWPHSEHMNGDGGIMQPVYLVQVLQGSSSLGNACIAMRADMVRDIMRPEHCVSCGVRLTLDKEINTCTECMKKPKK
jgi:hypothetical protein